MEETKKKLADNCIAIGGKDFSVYMRSVNVLFLSKNLKEISIKARGKNISRAADVSLAATRFIEGVSIKDVKIDSEEFEKEGKKLHVSSIDIKLIKS